MWDRMGLDGMGLWWWRWRCECKNKCKRYEYRGGDGMGISVVWCRRGCVGEFAGMREDVELRRGSVGQICVSFSE